MAFRGSRSAALSFLAWAALFIVATAVLVRLNELPLCPLAFFFGLPCPGCGLTRASLALLRGDLTSALHFHPLVFIALPIVSVALFVAVAAHWYPENRLQEWLRPRIKPWLERASVALLALFIGVWIARFNGAFGGPVVVTPIWQLMGVHGLRD